MCDSNTNISEIKTSPQLKLEKKNGGLFSFKLKPARPLVVVLRLEGGIATSSKGGSTLNMANLNKLLEKVFDKHKLKVLCLIINSPGGSPVQSEFIAKRIIDLAKKKEVTVYSFVEDVAASGGYWLACAGEKIFASKNSIIGSIGVVYSGFGFTEAISKIGVERRVYTQGRNKAILDPFQEIKESDVEIIKKSPKKYPSKFH